MKIKQQGTNRKKVWLIALLATVVVVGLLAAYFVFAKGHPTSLEKLIKGDSSSDESNSTKKQDEPKDSDKTVPPNTDHAAPPTTDESTGKQVIPVVASATVDGSIVYIRGGLNLLRTDGTCYAELTGPNGQKIRKDTTLLPNAGTTDCKTISIPVSELTTGKWTFTLNYSADDAEGQSSVASFTVS